MMSSILSWIQEQALPSLLAEVSSASFQFECIFLIGMVSLWLLSSKIQSFVSAAPNRLSPPKWNDPEQCTDDESAPSVRYIPPSVDYGQTKTLTSSHDDVCYRKDALIESARRRNIKTCNTILHAMAENQVLYPAVLAGYFRVLTSRKMTAEVVEAYGRYPTDDIAVLRIVLACASEEGQLELAKTLMQKIGDRANLRDWHARLRATKRVQHNRTEEALVVLKHMERSHVEADENIIVMVFHICIQDGNLEEAEKFCDGIGNKARFYDFLLRKYSEARSLQDVLRLFEKIKAGGKPTPSSYGTVLQACVTANELQLAFTFAQQMNEEGISLNTVNQTALIKGLCRVRLLDDALTMFSFIGNPDVITYSIVIKALADGQRITEACELLDRVETIDGEVDEGVYNSIILGCVYTDSIELAHGTFHRMLAQGIRPTSATISSLLKLYAKMKMWTEAMELLEKLEIYNIAPDPKLFRMVILSMCRRRQGRRVISIFQSFIKNTDGISILAHRREELGGEILSACVNFNLPETARDLIGLCAEIPGASLPLKDLDAAREFFQRTPPKGDIKLLNLEISVLRRNSEKMLN